MKRLIALSLLFLLFTLPAPAYAEDSEWDAGAPKGMTDGIVCIASATAGGHTYRNVNYVAADAGWMSSQPDRERAWQRSYCERVGAVDVVNYFRFTHGMTIEPSQVKITTRTYQP